MAIQTDVSSPANGTAAIFSLLTRLCAAGWLVKAWSDATTLVSGVSLSSNPYSGSGSGAGNLGNTSAWFRVQDAAGTREWLFQRGASDTSWTVSRTIAGTPFTGGSPTATTAGTSAAATALFSAASLFSAPPGRMFITCDSSSPYGWAMFCMTLGGGNVLTILADEPLASGTYEAGDTDPYIWIGYYNSTGLSAAGGFQPQQASTAQAYKRFVAASSNQRVLFAGLTDGNSGIAPATSTSSHIGQTPSGKERPRRICICRTGASSTSTGDCGDTTRIRWCVVGGRTNGQTLAEGTSNYWLYMAGAWVVWDSSAPTLS